MSVRLEVLISCDTLTILKKEESYDTSFMLIHFEDIMCLLYVSHGFHFSLLIQIYS